jgi:hypothetical protein
MPNVRSIGSAVGALAAAMLLAGVSHAPEQRSSDPYAIVRGMTLSCHRSGQSWATEATAESLAELRDLGVNWVAIHPYAGIRADGRVVVWGELYERDLTWLRRPIDEAHRLGLKILIKPHIAYWGSPFPWRGAIEFQSDDQWNRFFDTYEMWITRVAELCRDADAFVVGTELDRTIGYEREWRRIIASVRDHIDAPLTYAANWDRYKRVPFWDALDVIGIQAYFPLVAHEREPTMRELDRSWQRIMREIEAFARRTNRRVVFCELGYDRSAAAAVRPWESAPRGARTEQVQQRCMDAALAALRESDTVVGAFLWKWFPIGRTRGNFLMTTPAMQTVIEQHWGADAPIPPSRSHWGDVRGSPPER